MGNPLCPKKDAFGRTCHGPLKRQHSGRKRMWICQKNPKHRLIVGSAFDSVFKETPQ